MAGLEVNDEIWLDSKDGIGDEVWVGCWGRFVLLLACSLRLRSADFALAFKLY